MSNRTIKQKYNDTWRWYFMAQSSPIPRQDMHDHLQIRFILSEQLFRPIDFAVFELPPHRLHHSFHSALRRDDLGSIHHPLKSEQDCLAMLQHALHGISRVVGQVRLGIGIIVSLDLQFAKHGVHSTDLHQECLHLCLGATERVHAARQGYNDLHGDCREAKDAGDDGKRICHSWNRSSWPD